MPLGAVRAHAPRPSRTVAEMRPRPAVTLEAGMPVADAAKRMQAANSDAALVCERVGTEWKVRGILTDTDVMRKVVAVGRDPDAVTVDTVMTRNPQVVAAGARRHREVVDVDEVVVRAHRKEPAATRGGAGSVPLRGGGGVEG